MCPVWWTLCGGRASGPTTRHRHDQGVSASTPGAILPRIAGVSPGEQTNLSGGWLKGVEELGRASGEGPRKVLLLTDGLANVGMTDPAALTEVARSTAESSGVGTTTIGFGEHFARSATSTARSGGGWCSSSTWPPSPRSA